MINDHDAIMRTIELLKKNRQTAYTGAIRHYGNAMETDTAIELLEFLALTVPVPEPCKLIKDFKLLEVSLVTNPPNPHCVVHCEAAVEVKND